MYRKSRFNLPLLLLLFSPSMLSIQAVVSPLEKVTEELKMMQETVSSVQASLITSVSLLQDQLAEFTEKTSLIINTKLSNLEQQVDRINTNIASITEKTQVWDDVENKMNMWETKVSSIEDKIDDIKRSQDDAMLEIDKKYEIIPQVDFTIDKLNQKVSQLGSQMQVMDKRLISLQDNLKESKELETDFSPNIVLNKLSKIESELKNMTSAGHRRRPNKRHHNRNNGHRRNETTGVSMCQGNQEMLRNVQDKVETIWQAMETSDKLEQRSPRFEYLRSEAASENSEFHNGVREGSFSDNGDRVTHLHKMAIPFKRVNKRLTEIIAEVQTGNDDIQRQLLDFKAMASEISQERNLLLQGYAKDFASISQCCSGHSADYNRFVAQAGPVVDKMDRWMTSWQNLASQKFDRILQQNSYDHDTINKGQKALESFLMEGFDRCKMRDSRAGKRIRTTPSYSETTTKIPTTTTERVTTPEVIADNDVLKLPFVDESEILDDDVSSDTKEPYAKMPSGCDDLKHSSGSSSSKVYKVGVSRMYNEGGRDFNTRLCDQETSGGGWTVIQRRGDFGEPKINFTRSWKDYKHGFGDLNGEFWFGNDHISILSANKSVMLRIELEAHDGRRAYAEYSTFRVDSEDLDYRLWLGGYSGNASDSLSAHNGYKFSTVDRNNDQAPKCCPCAPAYGGGWWFYSCFESNLNGEYFINPDDNGYYRGIIWELWLGDYSLKAAKMMIRPKDFSVGYDPDSRDSLVVPPDP